MKQLLVVHQVNRVGHGDDGQRAVAEQPGERGQVAV
jgi:hypothetical protein